MDGIETVATNETSRNLTYETVVTSGAASSTTLTLEAIGSLLDTKLAPVNRTLSSLSTDLGEFKSKVRDEFNNMNMQVQSIDSRTTANHDKHYAISVSLESGQKTHLISTKSPKYPAMC